MHGRWTDSSIMKLSKGMRELSGTVTRIVGNKDTADVLQDTAEQIVKLHRRTKVWCPDRLVTIVASRRALDHNRKHYRTVLVDNVANIGDRRSITGSSTNQLHLSNMSNPWELLEAELDVEIMGRRMNNLATTTISKIIDRSIINILNKIIVISGSILNNKNVQEVLAEGDMLSSWMEDDDGRKMILLDGHVNIAMIDAFEDDLRLLTNAGGYGSVDIVSADGKCIKYTLGKHGVYKYLCAFTPLDKGKNILPRS